MSIWTLTLSVTLCWHFANCMATKKDGIDMNSGTRSRHLIPNSQSEQMGHLLANRNFSLTMQFSQKRGKNGQLFTVYAGSGLMILSVYSDVRAKRVVVQVRKRGDALETFTSTEEHDLADGDWHRVIIEIRQPNHLLLAIDCSLAIDESAADFDFDHLSERPSPSFMIGQTRDAVVPPLMGKLREFSVDRVSYIDRFCPALRSQLRSRPKSTTTADDVPFVVVGGGTRGTTTNTGTGSQTTDNNNNQAAGGVTFTRDTGHPEPHEHEPPNQPDRAQPVVRENEHHRNSDVHRTGSSSDGSIIHKEVKYLKHKVGHLENQFKQWRDVVRAFENELKTVQLHQRGCQLGANTLENGDKWTNNENCTECICILGEAICQPMGCPPVECERPVHLEGQCCPQCTAGQKCYKDGEFHNHGAVFWPKTCVRCECNSGHVSCQLIRNNDCPAVTCSHPETPPGECCPRCRNANHCQQKPCSPNATCINQEFDRVCECKPGFVGNGERCFDEDECAWHETSGTRKAKCGTGAICVNTIGSYRCQCKPGYTKLADGTCLDVIVKT